MYDGDKHETDGCDGDTRSHALAQIWSGLYAVSRPLHLLRQTTMSTMIDDNVHSAIALCDEY